MNIAIPVTDNSTEAQLNPRFGRAHWFCIINTKNNTKKMIGSDADQAAHGAGVQTGQLLIDHKVDAVIAIKYGPNAESVLSAGNIKMYNYPGSPSIKVDELLEWFKQTHLSD